MFARQKKQPKPKISAVIVAAGNGARMGTDCPKQFLTVFDKPIIAYTLQKFCDCDYVDSIVLVTQSDYIPLCRRICTSYGFDKVKVITEGGATRRESVANGLAQLPDDCEYVMIHDGARPLIDADMLEKSVTAAIENGAAAVGVRVKDTIKYSDDGKYITQTVDRSRLWQIQTPQMFEKNLIVGCHDRAARENIDATDDCMLAEKCGVKVAIVEGKYENIKITSPADLYIMQGLLESNL